MARFLQLSRQLEECLSRSGKHMYLLRHGESMGNSAGSIVGWTDTKLSVKGRNQSHELFKGLHKHVDKFTSIHSSDMSRCTDTLNFALGFSSRKVITHKDLRELNFGDDEGRHFDSLPEA